MKIRFGILGCGYIAERHAKHILANPLAELVSAYDIDFRKTRKLCTEFGVEETASLHDFLANEKIDIVNICTPNGTHAELSVAASSAGKHVLVEKPMATTSGDCKKMIEAAEKNKREIFVVKQNRFNPPVQSVKQLIDNNVLGKIYLVSVNCFWNRNKEYYINSEWKGRQIMDGGTLFTQFSHFIDVFYYLLGDVSDIAGTITNAAHKGLTEFEDSGCFNFRFTNGALGALVFTTAAYKQNMEGSITIFAENATVKIGGKYLNNIEYQCTSGFEIIGNTVSAPPNNYGYYEGSMSNHDKVIHNVIETLNNRETIMTNAYEGMKVVEIIERLYSSARTV